VGRSPPRGRRGAPLVASIGVRNVEVMFVDSPAAPAGARSVELPRLPAAAAAAGAAVELRGVTRTYGRGRDAVDALRDVSVTFPSRSFTAVMGASGSGKSTLLQCAAGLDAPTSGSVVLGGTEITSLKENRLTELRRAEIGFVFQSYNLLPSLTVLQNVLLPLRLAGQRPDRHRGEAMLERVGLAGYGGRRPAQLSGGQQQRVAIARALVTEPEVIFADEPTGALDTTTAEEVLSLLRRAVDQLGTTVVMVTHNPGAASYADRAVFLAGGTIAGQIDRPDATTVARQLGELVARPARVGSR
jgi:putative ABC transport system ATP-binding protein